ncbi:MAG TPA: YqaA family protein [Stellaceae bacterium]|nr:YqaA family protein [Stellaceae bacterium]
MLRALYQRTLSLAASKHAVPALAAVAFIESSVFPIPPDALLIPMMVAQPHRAFRLAAICTVMSVLGGFLGYAIGYYAFDAFGEPILRFYGAMARYEELKQSFAEYGAWIIILKGMTPIPYKLITIASGVFKFSLLAFALASIISRSMRFFLEGALFWWFGPPIRDFIERRLVLVTSAFAVALVGGFLVLRYV